MKKSEQLLLGRFAISKGFISESDLKIAITSTKGKGDLLNALVEKQKLNKKQISSLLEQHKTLKEKKTPRPKLRTLPPRKPHHRPKKTQSLSQTTNHPRTKRILRPPLPNRRHHLPRSSSNNNPPPCLPQKS
jgi:hypothetical protein